MRVFVGRMDVPGTDEKTNKEHISQLSFCCDGMSRLVLSKDVVVVYDPDKKVRTIYRQAEEMSHCFLCGAEIKTLSADPTEPFFALQHVKEWGFNALGTIDVMKQDCPQEGPNALRIEIKALDDLRKEIVDMINFAEDGREGQY